jgi:hypothetical protein
MIGATRVPRPRTSFCFTVLAEDQFGAGSFGLLEQIAIDRRADGHDQVQPLTISGGLPKGVADMRGGIGDHRRVVQVIAPPSEGVILG